VSVFSLIQKFDTRRMVPIEVEEVADFIRGLGVKDEIYFWDAEISPATLQAAITHWEYPDDKGNTTTVADIHTSRDLPPYEKRLAEVKEMLHILDPEHYRVNTIENVRSLIEKIVLPQELVDWQNDGIHANSDRAATIHAVAVLFPWETREHLIAPFKAGKITLTDIADLVALPVEYVVVVMSDFWPTYHDAMIAPQKMRYPDKVITLKADHSAIEVYSVPLGDDPYTYARKMHERNNMRGPIASIPHSVWGA